MAAGFLLLSMGGAIVAAPVTVPVMVQAARRHPTRGLRITAAALGSLTVAEVVWGAVYVGWHEAEPWIWVLPIIAGSAFAVVITRTTSPARPPVAIAAGQVRRPA